MHHAKKIPVVGQMYAGEVLLLMSALTGTNFFSHSADDAITRLGQRPVLIIHGTEDVGIPEYHAQRLYDAVSGPREIWYGPGPHSNIITTVPSKYARRVFDFLDAQWRHLDATATLPKGLQNGGQL